MPELPDVEIYIEALRPRVVGQPLQRARLLSPFLVRSVDPPLSAVEGQRVDDVRRLGKRIVLVLSDDLFLVFHLMIAGRFRWEARGARAPGRIGLAAFDFPTGTLLMTACARATSAPSSGIAGSDPSSSAVRWLHSRARISAIAGPA